VFPKYKSRVSTDHPVDRRGIVFGSLIGTFVCLVVLTNTVGTKLFTVGPLTLPVSIFCFPLTFLVTDVVSEIFGEKQARFFVIVGFLMSMVLLVLVLIGLALPPAPGYALEAAYQKVFSPTWRLFFASMAAYLLAQMIDVRVFHFVKKLSKGRRLWLRNNASTMFSQLVDTFTVAVIFLWKNEAVFTGDFGDLLVLVFSAYVAKVVIAALDTPLIYAVVWWIRRYLGASVPARG
jgi:uncharacterized integral membrane protein (TIGR00697 family)